MSPGRAVPAFRPVIERYRLAVETPRATVFGLDMSLRIAFVNAGWDAFAAANGGQPTIAQKWDLGARYLDCVPAVLRPFYLDLLDRSRAQTPHPVVHEYECPSPELRRRYAMHVYPVEPGYLIVSSLLLEEPHALTAAEPDAPAESDELLRQCSHCRRIEHGDGEHEQWSWVPAWAARPPGSVSHGLCPACFEHYYPPPPRRRLERRG